jgi:phosphotriesterase-related protein
MTVVHTVLGPVPAEELGVVAVHEALLSVVPGAQHGFDITIDRAEIFETLAAQLCEFAAYGGGTVVDSTGMFHGRDVRLYEALSRATGVHIVASTGMGPEAMLGGYFLTPQTNPPTPWPAEKFADLFTREITEGMVVPRVERRGSAGMVVSSTTQGGRTATDESLLQGLARAALATGAPVSLRLDSVDDLDVVLKEGLPAHRIAVVTDDPAAVAERGAYVVVTDPAAVDGLPPDRVLLASGGVAVSVGEDAPPASYAGLLTALPADVVDQVLVANPRALLAIEGS